MSLLNDAKATIAKFLVNMGRFDQVMNGDKNTDVPVDVGTVPTLRKLFDYIVQNVIGVVVKGSVNTIGDLPSSGNKIGDIYIILNPSANNAANDGYVWTGSAPWRNIGQIRGPKGDKGDQGIQGIPGDLRNADVPYSPNSFGGVGDGTTADDDAFDQMIAKTGGEVIITSRNWRLTRSATWPRGKIYRFAPGAKISPDANVTITIKGLIEAPLSQIFAGNGKVVGIAEVWPEWFGAIGNGSVNDQPALQAAHDCVELSSLSDGNGACIKLRGGNVNYGLGKQWTLRPTASFNLKVIGGGPVLGTNFTTLASFDTSLGPAAIRIQGTSDTIQQIAGYQIGNFSIALAANSAALVGMWVGGDGKAGTGQQKGLIGVQANQIHDIHVKDGFAFNWRVANCRLIDFNRCSGWNRNKTNVVALLITVDSPGAFTGDLNFNSCQFIVDLLDQTKCVSITNGLSGGAEIKGVGFGGSIFYHGDRFFEIYAFNGGAIGDIWIMSRCQFDGFGHQCIYIEANGAGSQIDDIHINDSYMRGFTGAPQIYTKGSNGGLVATVMAHGNFMASFSSGARACTFDIGTRGCSFNDNSIEDIAGIDYIVLVNSGGNNVIANIVANGAGASNFSSLVAIGEGVDYCNISLNNHGGLATGVPILNLSSATHNSIYGNNP